MRLIICAFAFLAFAFWELSGGAEFDPVETRMARVELPTADDGRVEVAVAPQPAVATIVPVKLNLERVTFEPSEAEAEAEAPVVTEAEPAETLERPKVILPSLVLSASAQAAAPVIETPTEPEFPVRLVTGSRVNVRGGPGTEYQVLNTLVQGDEVEILQDSGTGWLQLRPVAGGPVGWMAEFLLSEG